MSLLRKRKHMVMARAAALAGAFAVALLAGCGGGTTGVPNGGAVGTTASFDFNAGMQGWTADFSDLPVNYDPMAYELAYTHANLPAPLDTTKKALCLTSHNRSDDLWYFVKKQVTGLKPNTRYALRFEIEIASDAPENSVGAGGSPGASVVLKAGASAIEPQITVGMRNGVQSRVFNLDKGEQFQPGKDVVILGNIAIPGDEMVYALKQLDSGDQKFSATTDGSGQLWTFFGTESGFEGLQTIYYTRFKLTLTPA